ncbi:DMT family transporter [Candidatus Roizmanbacteria bacterium]|nr:DMT family transporter [Candidatus Roizmanbacteria bacterium]
MNWIIASLIMFASSVALYVLIRKAALLKIPTEFVNLASMGIPFFLYITLAVRNNTHLALTPTQLIIMILLSVFGSYLPNVASLKSIKFAPNPGYSLIISKSYVVFTTIVAIFLFNSHLSIKSALAITIIIGFSVLIMMGKSKPHAQSNSLWLPLSFVSFFGWGFLSIGTKYAFTTGLNIYQRLVFLSIFVTSFIVTEIVVRKVKFPSLKPVHILLLIAIGTLSSSFNFFMTLGIDLAPNIGYVNAINASSISAVTVFSALLFKDDFSMKKFLGVMGVTAGLLLLIL